MKRIPLRFLDLDHIKHFIVMARPRAIVKGDDGEPA